MTSRCATRTPWNRSLTWADLTAHLLGDDAPPDPSQSLIGPLPVSLIRELAD